MIIYDTNRCESCDADNVTTCYVPFLKKSICEPCIDRVDDARRELDRVIKPIGGCMKKMASALCSVLVAVNCMGQDLSVPALTVPIDSKPHQAEVTAEEFLVMETPDGTLHMTAEQARAKLEAANLMAQQSFDDQPDGIFQSYPRTTIGLLAVLGIGVGYILIEALDQAGDEVTNNIGGDQNSSDNNGGNGSSDSSTSTQSSGGGGSGNNSNE